MVWLQTKSKFGWPLRHKWLFLLCLIFLLIVGFFAYQKIALDLNRRAFAQARVAIDTVYADIVAQVGPPDNYRRISECSRPSVEFGQGPLSCDVATDFIYGVTDKEQADLLKSQIQDVIKRQPESLRLSTAPQSFIEVNPAPGNNTDSTIDYYKTQAGMECAAKYTYDMPREIELSTNDPNRNGFGISIGCYADAKAQYYPIHQPS